MTTQVGFIGLGAMGRPMAAVLAGAGYSVKVFDQDAGTRQSLAERDSIEAMASVAETAAGADVLFTCLPNDEIVRRVYLEPAGVASAIRLWATGSSATFPPS